MYQIIEQIIPFFPPTLYVTAKTSKLLPTSIQDDLGFTLTDIANNNPVTFDYNEDLQVYEATMTFVIEGYIYGPTYDSGLIRTADVTFIDGDKGHPYSKVIVQIDPITAAPGGTFGISSGVTPFNAGVSFGISGGGGTTGLDAIFSTEDNC